MIQLPARDTEDGLESRVLLAECRGPAERGYNLADATSCMQLMDRVLYNRVDNPRPFLAHANTLLAVVRARGQFQGFENYPHYSQDIIDRIQQMIDVANNARDPRAAQYTSHIQAAISVARAASIKDPSPGTLAYWRTSGSGSPATVAKLYRTFLGIDFWYLP